MNTRRKQFQDPRVRRAFNLAFNFEGANKNLFYGQYIRVDSYFGNTEMEATGLPQGRELEILNEVKDGVRRRCSRRSIRTRSPAGRWSTARTWPRP